MPVKTDAGGGPPGRYLTDERGKAVYLVDPGINGMQTTRLDGTEVRKYDAPKAVLASYIIKGILSRAALEADAVRCNDLRNPETAGVPSLPFAVGSVFPSPRPHPSSSTV